MGFRAGAQKIFGGEFAPDPVTTGEAGNLGQLMRGVEQDKAKLKADERKVAENNLKGISDILNNVGKMPKGLRKLSLVPLTQRFNAQGINPDPEYLSQLVVNDEAMAQLGVLTSELASTTDPQRKQQLMGVLGELADTSVNREKALDFIAKLGTADSDSDALGDATKLISSESSIRKDFGLRIKESRSIIQDANKIFGLSRQPDNPFASGIAPTILAKVADPATGVREAEAKRMESIAPGFWSRVKGAANKIKIGVGLEPEAWSELLQAVRIVAKDAQNDIDSARGEFSSSTQKLEQFGSDSKSLLGTTSLNEGFEGDLSPESIKSLFRKSKKSNSSKIPMQAAMRDARKAFKQGRSVEDIRKAWVNKMGRALSPSQEKSITR